LVGPRPTLSDTREKLLHAAEKLFATKGIDGTAIREVNALAGQRNTSAIRYHFDGMAGLLESLVELRMGELDQARRRALEGLEAERAPERTGVEDYVGVLVLPLAERVHAEEDWACWVRVLGQLISVRGHEHRRLWEGRFDQTTRDVFRRIRARLPEIPEAVWKQRLEDLMTLCIGSLCERACKLEQGGQRGGLRGRAYSANLVQIASALLRAPI